MGLARICRAPPIALAFPLARCQTLALPQTNALSASWIEHTGCNMQKQPTQGQPSTQRQDASQGAISRPRQACKQEPEEPARETQAESSWTPPSQPHAATCRRRPHPPLVRSAVLLTEEGRRGQESLEGLMAQTQAITAAAAAAVAAAVKWMVLLALRLGLGTRPLNWLARRCCCFLVPMTSARVAVAVLRAVLCRSACQGRALIAAVWCVGEDRGGEDKEAGGEEAVLRVAVEGLKGLEERGRAGQR